MKHEINEKEFKSIDNSKHYEGKGWCILKILIKKTPDCLMNAGPLCLYRQIVYLDSHKRPYQIGCVFMPFNLFNLTLFIRLLLSRRTFGHYISEKYKGVEFTVISSENDTTSFNILFNTSSIIKSKRIISIPKLKFQAYVEEECLCF